jgi:2-haloalkanoic acid dehalogenase type II
VKKLDLDCAASADAWRAGYRPAMDRVRRGDLPWMNIDALHRLVLDEILARFGVRGLKEAEKDHLNRVWHRLRPWPDAVRGLRRLKKKYVIATLSNGNVALLTNMARNAGLPWDCVFSAELFHHYKPDPADLSGRCRAARPRAGRGDDGRRPRGRPHCGAQVRAAHRLRASAARVRTASGPAAAENALRRRSARLPRSGR